MTGGIVAEYASVMLKGLGAAILTHICAMTCRECGRPSLADTVELAGKIERFILCLPLIKKIVETATSLMEL